MTKNTLKQKIIITLIFLVPFALLVTRVPEIEVLLVIYAGYFIYLTIDKEVIKVQLPPIGEDIKSEVAKQKPRDESGKFSKSELPGLSNVRKAEQNIHDELNKSITKKLVKKPTIKKHKQEEQEDGNKHKIRARK